MKAIRYGIRNLDAMFISQEWGYDVIVETEAPREFFITKKGFQTEDAARAYVALHHAAPHMLIPEGGDWLPFDPMDMCWVLVNNVKGELQW
jgi:hypothetical protein